MSPATVRRGRSELFEAKPYCKDSSYEKCPPAPFGNALSLGGMVRQASHHWPGTTGCGSAGTRAKRTLMEHANHSAEHRRTSQSQESLADSTFSGIAGTAGDHRKNGGQVGSCSQSAVWLALSQF